MQGKDSAERQLLGCGEIKLFDEFELLGARVEVGTEAGAAASLVDASGPDDSIVCPNESSTCPRHRQG